MENKLSPFTTLRAAILQTIPLGFQQYLTMFGSTVAIPLIFAETLGASASWPIGGLTIIWVIGMSMGAMTSATPYPQAPR